MDTRQTKLCSMKRVLLLLATALFACQGLAVYDVHAADIAFTRVPGGGLQPQALVSPDGTVHLIYYKGDPGAGDLFYVDRPAGSEQFTNSMRVNSRPGSAIAVGTIRGAQMALGKNGHVHVAWNGSGDASGHPGAPMLYTRLNDQRTAFEPQRDAMTFTGGLDGGGSVAADPDGNVYVAWHGNTPATQGKETERAVFLAVSRNEGASFAREQRVNPEPTGACGCCGLKTFADAQGDLYLLYRAARHGTERDETLLASRDHGQTFSSLYAHPWKATTCPMSSAWLGSTLVSPTIAAWETKGHVWFTTIDLSSRHVREPIAPTSGGSQKHPVAVSNPQGETLLVWAEGTGWQKGGAVAWQLFDAQGKPIQTAGRKDGIPTWSFAAAVVRSDGKFEIIY
jgi:hypothetical protein